MGFLAGHPGVAAERFAVSTAENYGNGSGVKTDTFGRSGAGRRRRRRDRFGEPKTRSVYDFYPVVWRRESPGLSAFSVAKVSGEIQSVAVPRPDALPSSVSRP